MIPETLIRFCRALQDPLAIVDSAGRILMSNPAFCDLLGYTGEEFRRTEIAFLVPAHRRHELTQYMADCLQGIPVIAVPSELQSRDAGFIPVILTLSIFHIDHQDPALIIWSVKKASTSDSSLERLNLILEDTVESRDNVIDQTMTALEEEVSERLGVENELRMSRQQLRRLSRKTLELLENDRQVIAKELHDSIGASLAAIKFSLEGWLEAYGNQLPSPEIPFERIIDHILETIKETKRISASLRPSTLDDLGLIATAKWFCRDLSGLYAGIRIIPRFDVGETEIPDAYKIVLYRVMQEALSNAAKHSGAHEIEVTLKRMAPNLEMIIADDGSGFDLDRVLADDNALSGFGIDSMRERIEICNGCFDIRTREGVGTRIRVVLPL